MLKDSYRQSAEVIMHYFCFCRRKQMIMGTQGLFGKPCFAAEMRLKCLLKLQIVTNRDKNSSGSLWRFLNCICLYYMLLSCAHCMGMQWCPQ